MSHTPPTAADNLMHLVDRHAAHLAVAEIHAAADRQRAVEREISRADEYRARVRAEVDRLYADRTAAHLLPLLDLTADEVAVVIAVMADRAPSDPANDPLHASALDKLTTTEEPA